MRLLQYSTYMFPPLGVYEVHKTEEIEVELTRQYGY